MIHQKTGPNQFINFMPRELAESVCGPVVMNSNEMCIFPAADGSN